MKWKSSIRDLLLVLIIFVLIYNISFSVFAASDNEMDNFCGSRRVTYIVDKSDLNNFVDGGRSSFDIVLRSNVPLWLNYEIYASDRNVYLEINFDFGSFDDYTSKLKELLTYAPILFYSTDNSLLLLESYSAMELLNFLQTILTSLDCLTEQQLSEIFTITENEITINESNYSSEESRLSIRSDIENMIKLDVLKISTKGGKNGSYNRNMTVQVDTTSNEDALNTIIKRFKQIGKTIDTELSDNVIEVCVEFNAVNQDELISKTMSCLNVASSISEQQSYIDDTTIGVTRTEFIDLTELMRENAQFHYYYEYPSYYNNVVSVDDVVSVTDTTITAQNESYISCYYERGFKFDSIKVCTDLSNILGKITRTITLVAPIEISEYYHNIIKEQLQSRLIRGTTLNIYDAGGSRYYELNYSSWFTKDIGKFTSSIMNCNYNLILNNSWIPYGKSNLKDNFSVNSIINNMVPADKTIVSYILPMGYQKNQ